MTEPTQPATLADVAHDSVPPDLLAAALSPNFTFGDGAAAATVKLAGEYVLLTQDEPWAIMRDQIPPPHSRVMVRTMEESEIDALVRGFPPRMTVVGLGGGSAMDAAKYAASITGGRLILIPTAVSVDAVVTNTIAVRNGGRVRYIGFVVADDIVIDSGVITCAPRALNRAGIGDLLSIHTAVHDWRLGALHGSARFDESIARDARGILGDLEPLLDGVRDVTGDAIEAIVRAHARANALCLRAGSSQPEEGSEHYWAYHAEAITGRHFVHGELVGLGIVLMSRLQQNDPAWPEAFLDRAGVGWRPKELGLDRDTLVTSLTRLGEYVDSERLPYSVIDEQPIDADRAVEILGDLI